MQPSLPSPLQQVSIEPLPGPVNYQIGDVMIAGKRWIALKFDDLTGCKVVYFEPEAAKQMAQKITATALGLSLVQPNNNHQNGG